MAFLEQFDDIEKDLLVMLPYRAGLWVSKSDNAGGNESSSDEVSELHKIIAQKAKGMFESAFVHEVMIETCAREKQWPDWSSDLDNVPEECKKMVAIVEAKLSRHDMDAYKHNVMFIATEVAKSYREFDVNMALPVRVFTCFKIAVDKMFGKIRGVTYESEDLLNISYEEDIALSQLSTALHSNVNDDDENEIMQSPE